MSAPPLALWVRGYGIFLFLVLLCTCGPAPSPPAEPNSYPPRPNIIYILADDMGFGDLSVLGQRSFRTPHIDRLAAEGMLFTQHYAGSAVCAPSRATLMTGLHTGHSPVRGHVSIPGIGVAPLTDSVMILPEAIKRGTDYTTAMSGRWHLGGELSDQTPFDRGFEYHFGKLSADFPNRTGVFNGSLYDEAGHHVPYEVYRARAVEPMYENGSYYNLNAEELAADTINMDRMVTDKAKAYISRRRTRPYFLYVAYSIPHEPMDYHSDFPVSDSLPPAERAFVSMMLALDAYVGELVAAVDDSGQKENTLILFTTDNGAHSEGGHSFTYFNSSGPFSEYKRSFHEGGLRAPLIARWPGTVAAGSRSDHLCAMWDMLPTVCELAGASPPDPTDGISIVPTLTGRGKQAEHDYLYWEFNENLRFQKTEFKQAVRAGKWKGIYYIDEDRFELYDVTVDMAEREDVAAGHPAVVRRLRKMMQQAHTPSGRFPLLAAERQRPEG